MNINITSHLSKTSGEVTGYCRRNSTMEVLFLPFLFDVHHTFVRLRRCLAEFGGSCGVVECCTSGFQRFVASSVVDSSCFAKDPSVITRRK